MQLYSGVVARRVALDGTESNIIPVINVDINNTVSAIKGVVMTAVEAALDDKTKAPHAAVLRFGGLDERENQLCALEMRARRLIMLLSFCLVTGSDDDGNDQSDMVVTRPKPAWCIDVEYVRPMVVNYGPESAQVVFQWDDQPPGSTGHVVRLLSVVHYGTCSGLDLKCS